MHASHVVKTDPALALGNATARAAAMLGINGRDLAQIVGCSELAVSRVIAGDHGIDPSSKAGELSLLLVRMFRSLDALVGGQVVQRLAWMNTFNTAVNGVPADLIRTAEGLVRTLDYLDGMSAPN